jgi:hypothetical protein
MPPKTTLASLQRRAVNRITGRSTRPPRLLTLYRRAARKLTVRRSG